METQTFSERIEKLKLESLKLADNVCYQIDRALMGEAMAIEALIFNHREDCAKQYGTIQRGDDYLHIDTRCGVFKMHDYDSSKIDENVAVQIKSSTQDIQKRRKLLISLQKTKCQ